MTYTPAPLRLLKPLLSLLMASALLAGCEQRTTGKFESGLATEVDVLRDFGTPIDIQHSADGVRVLEYTRQPEGSANYFISIGADGKVLELNQVLQPKYFEQVKPGMEVAQVRRLLGRPATKEYFELKKEEVWDWRWIDGQTRKLFRVTFDPNGKVLASQTLDDPRGINNGH